MNRVQKSGFTLLEMMISFVILSIAITSIYKALTLGLTTAQLRLQRYEATEIALSLIAELEVIPPLSQTKGEIGTLWRWDAKITPASPVETLPANLSFSQLEVHIYRQNQSEALISMSRILPPEYAP